MAKDPRTDEIAQEDARLVGGSNTVDIGKAINRAAKILNYEDAPKPGLGRVRKHIQAQSMQFQGREEYQQTIKDLWLCAESIMTSLAFVLSDAEFFLVGRAAEGHIDGGLRAHMRIYTTDSITTVSQILEEHGYEEIEHKTLDTKHGRLNAIHITESPWLFVLIRCPMEFLAHKSGNLFTGKVIKVVSLSQLRELIDQSP